MISDSTKRARFDAAAPLEGIGTELHRTVNLLKAVYDFAVLGGAVGDILLLDDLGNPAILPAGALVKRVIVRVPTAVLSGGSATVALKAVGAADLLGATAKASLTVDALLDGVPQATAATAVKIAAASQVKATVATAALTAGKIYAFIEYYAAAT